ncbi:MAG: LytTR family DNA-binding domain-containing protein [Flavobacteriales bacterium]|nr:LytTR family DNA-binding domain-containing protein [Flavobacteriales bacterium]
MKAVIIDDEEKARENLKFLLEEFCPEVKPVALVGTIDAAVEAIKQHQPDFILLDIRMKGETGFQLFDKLESVDFEIIFTTAFDEYAIQAFKLSAIDYLLKPIDVEELKDAVAKVSKMQNKMQSKEKVTNLIKNLDGEQNNLTKLALPTFDGLSFVKIEDILRCESDENYTKFFLKDGSKRLVSKTIKFYEELLTPHNFFRVHRSHMVNLEYVTDYYKGDGGSVKLVDGTEVMVSRRRKEDFLKNFPNK